MLEVLLLVVGATLVSVVARRIDIPAPIALVVAGLLVSFVPGVPDYHLDPELALLVFVPPLVYADAVESSYLNLRANARPIGLLSVGLVLFTTLVVGLVAHTVIPGMPWAVAFVLGAILAPTDSVAAVAIARRLGLPRRIVTILVAESIVNDATGMTVFRMAVAVALGGTTTILQGTGEFLFGSLGGVAVGLLLAPPVRRLRCWLADAVAENAVSLLVPFGAYAIAEALHTSGVMAVLAAGLYLGHHSTGASHEARLQEKATLRLSSHLLEAVSFALIGLQLRPVLQALRTTDPLALGWYAAVVLATLLLARIAWVYPATYLPRRLSARLRNRDPAPPWRFPAAICWAGTRGVVSLAAAFAVPATMPRRDLVLFLAFAAVLGTLLVQGVGFPAVVRRLGLRDEGQAHQDDLAEAVAQETAARAAWARMEELVTSGQEAPPGHVLDRLRELADHRCSTAWERLRAAGVPAEAEPPTAAYRRLRREMLAIERGVFVRLCREGRLHDEVLRRVMHELDLEESVLSRG
ncbi:Na+/H+ antiporter [Kitasatospora sp. MAP5-34]|uniref:Na+/H+ antiporter n=1 Tax=Kitasatospora sp. MAP5-34 TaxID=3035102 RepID=UPI0024744528|nr:Na+/H+ antiporter [Kitasatospora sp. MAP5-34]MDH6574778.1 Na+/H+ antiporter [Kitasatospora sp. MAP5-34]